MTSSLGLTFFLQKQLWCQRVVFAEAWLLALCPPSKQRRAFWSLGWKMMCSTNGLKKVVAYEMLIVLEYCFWSLHLFMYGSVSVKKGGSWLRVQNSMMAEAEDGFRLPIGFDQTWKQFRCLCWIFNQNISCQLIKDDPTVSSWIVSDST